MTDEELKQEAIKYAVDYPASYGKGYKHKDLRIAYLAGAEPREKRIKHLEESLLDVMKKSVKRIEELEKENERLKGHLELWENGGCRATNLFECGVVKELKEQLTKAKDHIKKLLDCLKQDTNDPQTNYYVCKYMDKAEQFLKDQQNG